MSNFSPSLYSISKNFTSNPQFLKVKNKSPLMGAQVGWSKNQRCQCQFVVRPIIPLWTVSHWTFFCGPRNLGSKMIQRTNANPNNNSITSRLNVNEHYGSQPLTSQGIIKPVYRFVLRDTLNDNVRWIASKYRINQTELKFIWITIKYFKVLILTH